MKLTDDGPFLTTQLLLLVFCFVLVFAYGCAATQSRIGGGITAAADAANEGDCALIGASAPALFMTSTMLVAANPLIGGILGKFACTMFKAWMGTKPPIVPPHTVSPSAPAAEPTPSI